MIVVIGNSCVRSVFVENSAALSYVGRYNGLTLRNKKIRLIPNDRRYLPPPNKRSSGAALRTRMREEVVLRFSKEVG